MARPITDGTGKNVTLYVRAASLAKLAELHIHPPTAVRMLIDQFSTGKLPPPPEITPKPIQERIVYKPEGRCERCNRTGQADPCPSCPCFKPKK